MLRVACAACCLAITGETYGVALVGKNLCSGVDITLRLTDMVPTRPYVLMESFDLNGSWATNQTFLATNVQHSVQQRAAA